MSLQLLYSYLLLNNGTSVCTLGVLADSSSYYIPRYLWYLARCTLYGHRLCVREKAKMITVRQLSVKPCLTSTTEYRVGTYSVLYQVSADWHFDHCAAQIVFVSSLAKIHGSRFTRTYFLRNTHRSRVYARPALPRWALTWETSWKLLRRRG